MKVYDKKNKRLMKLSTIKVDYNLLVGITSYGESVILESYDSAKEAEEAFEWLVYQTRYDYATRR